jgi:Flp pilus assembly pilin Flp
LYLIIPRRLRLKTFLNLCRRLAADENAAEVTELGVVLALIVAGAVVTIALIGPKLQAYYSKVNADL